MPSFDDELHELRQRALLRRLRTFDSPQQPEVSQSGKMLINFASNDYLGLATEPALCDAAKAAIDQYGVGSGASRLVSGTLAGLIPAWRAASAPVARALREEAVG